MLDGWWFIIFCQPLQLFFGLVELITGRDYDIITKDISHLPLFEGSKELPVSVSVSVVAVAIFFFFIMVLFLFVLQSLLLLFYCRRPDKLLKVFREKFQTPKYCLLLAKTKDLVKSCLPSLHLLNKISSWKNIAPQNNNNLLATFNCN